MPFTARVLRWNTQAGWPQTSAVANQGNGSNDAEWLVDTSLSNNGTIVLLNAMGYPVSNTDVSPPATADKWRLLGDEPYKVHRIYGQLFLSWGQIAGPAMIDAGQCNVILQFGALMKTAALAVLDANDPEHSEEFKVVQEIVVAPTGTFIGGQNYHSREFMVDIRQSFWIGEQHTFGLVAHTGPQGARVKTYCRLKATVSPT